MTCEPRSATDGVDFWLRHQWVWHAYTAAALTTMAAITVVSEDDRGARFATLAIVAFLGLWYALVGVRAMAWVGRWPAVYFAGVAVAFPSLVWIVADGSWLLCYLLPQAYAMFDRTRHGVAAAAVLQGSMGVVIIAREQLTGWAVVSVLALTTLSIAVSALLGLFIRGIINQSAKRAGLITELEQAREELARERHDAGVRAERERLAAEIHDTLAQGFTSILMLSQAARAALVRAPETAGEQLDVIEQTARESLTEARSLVTTLTPAELTDGSLPDALRRLAEMYRRGTGLAVDVAVTGEPPALAADRDVVLLRAAQETLHNVRKHAGARHVAVALRYTAAGSTLTVTDNGRGFDSDASHDGYGLRGMRQRVEAQGGALTVRSCPDSGTTVEIQLPEPRLPGAVR